MIKINANPKDWENDVNVLLRYVEKAVSIHLFGDLQELEKKNEMYFHKNLNYNNDPYVNKTKYIVDTATQTFIGEFPYISTFKSNKIEKNRCMELNRTLIKSHLSYAVFNSCRDSSLYGVGRLLIYNKENARYPSFKKIDCLTSNVVYDSTIENNELFAFIIDKQRSFCNKKTNVVEEYYRVYIYDKDNMYIVITQNFTNLSQLQNNISLSFPNFENANPNPNIIKHRFSGIPLTEIFNNDDKIGDAEPVFDLINAYNRLQTNRFLNIEDVVNYFLFLKNFRVGNEEEQNTAMSLLKKERVLAMEGDNVDAKFLTNPLDQQQVQVLASDFEKLIHKISRVPDISDETFAQNASEPVLKIKLKPLLDLAKEKENELTPKLEKMIKMFLSYVEYMNASDFNKMKVDLDYIEYQYSHTLPSNDTDLITEIVNLNSANCLNKEEALKNITWIKDINKYMSGIETKVVDTTTKTNNNENEEKIVDKKQMDNKINFALGNAMDNDPNDNNNGNES